MGGTGSQEFMVSTEAGENLIASSSSGYAANVEKATSKLAPVADLAPSGNGLPELVHTPGQKTIDEVGAFLGVERVHQMKTMAYMASFRGEHGFASVPVVALLRGDHDLNETKLCVIVGCSGLMMMDPIQIPDTFGTVHGFLGPISLSPISPDSLRLLQCKGILPKSIAGPDQEPVWSDDSTGSIRIYPKNPIVILDAALEGRTNLIAGANKEEYHLRNVTPMRDFKPTLIADVRSVNEGELDPIGGQPLKIAKAVEIGHIFKLGYKYSKSMGATVLNRDGKETTPIMGSYGIGIERILTAAIEQSAAKFAAQQANDPKATDSYALPPSIAPFQVVVTITNVREAELLAAGEKIAADLSAAGIDVLLDDRDERAGVKFKDAELIGVPFRIAVGKKLAEGKVELLNRLTNRTGDIPAGEAAQHLTAALHAV
jgi:prolyl-tRNA synthetase